MVQFKLLLDISSSSDWGGIQLTTPVSAVGLATDCAMRPGADPDEIFSCPAISHLSPYCQCIHVSTEHVISICHKN